MSKQTAVEWFYQRILAKDIKEVFEQAKQMEKEQIEFSYNCGWADGHDEATNENPLFTTGEEYYKETYDTSRESKRVSR